jgi:hypothetical protein
MVVVVVINGNGGVDGSLIALYGVQSHLLKHIFLRKKNVTCVGLNYVPSLSHTCARARTHNGF